ncbi:hypothetical protein R3P38DRAFT_3293495 [Favolaschia claudopus]|uniref:Uncharacterized protein n=1 Tax=Favolaschia claudopus TaxID=2862362 RepID=A0AAV9ZHV1_9AGAR
MDEEESREDIVRVKSVVLHHLCSSIVLNLSLSHTIASSPTRTDTPHFSSLSPLSAPQTHRSAILQAAYPRRTFHRRHIIQPSLRLTLRAPSYVPRPTSSSTPLNETAGDLAAGTYCESQSSAAPRRAPSIVDHPTRPPTRAASPPTTSSSHSPLLAFQLLIDTRRQRRQRGDRGDMRMGWVLLAKKRRVVTAPSRVQPQRTTRSATREPPVTAPPPPGISHDLRLPMCHLPHRLVEARLAFQFKSSHDVPADPDGSPERRQRCGRRVERVPRVPV